MKLFQYQRFQTVMSSAYFVWSYFLYSISAVWPVLHFGTGPLWNQYLSSLVKSPSWTPSSDGKMAFTLVLGLRTTVRRNSFKGTRWGYHFSGRAVEKSTFCLPHNSRTSSVRNREIWSTSTFHHITSGVCVRDLYLTLGWFHNRSPFPFLLFKRPSRVICTRKQNWKQVKKGDFYRHRRIFDRNFKRRLATVSTELLIREDSELWQHY